MVTSSGRRSRRPRSKNPVLSGLLLATAGLALAACQTTNFAPTSGGSAQSGTQQQAAQPAPTLSPNVSGERIGSGPVRIALLLPTGAQGGLGVIGQQLANAARLGVRDFGAGRIQIVLKDTKGQAAEASLLADQGLKEGSSLIMGPLLSANVSAVKGVTSASNRPVLAFTSDQSRAGRNAYLLSFPPEADVSRTISHAISQGSNRIVALLPNDTYGRLVERTLRSTINQQGGQLVALERYGRDDASIQLAARSAALAVGTASAIYIPDGRNTPLRLLRALQKNGVSLQGKQVLGSGQWESAKLTDPLLQGALFAGPDKTNFEVFAQRYQATYSTRPSTTAALAYDAVSLVSELVRRNPQAPFTPQSIQSSNGFNGATGLFRFRATGRVQRGLVVNQVQGGRPVVVSPAPRNFTN